MIKAFTSPNQFLHDPSFEIYEYGQRIRYFESPERLQKMLSDLPKDGLVAIAMAEPATVDQISCHDQDYLTFLQTIYTRWELEAPRDAKRYHSLFPVSQRPSSSQLDATSIPALLGTYVKDLSAPIMRGTWQAALASAGCAIAGVNEFMLQDDTLHKNIAVALCRPPGHHAGISSCAGYCYINNAALAANVILQNRSVAILDIDYHAGNGTQQIFYENPQVPVCSIHADPANEYPYFAGFANETGSGAGLGFHKNLPLPSGTDPEAYINTLSEALEWLASKPTDTLVLSAGFDTYKDDPLGCFKLTTDTYHTIGSLISKLGKPVLVVLEGGYKISMLPTNLLALLHGLSE